MADLFPTFRRLSPRGWLAVVLCLGGLAAAIHIIAPDAGHGLIRNSYYQHNLATFAANGDAGAQYQLARRYERASPPDYGRAREWYERAAAQGHTDAHNNLGVLHELGQGTPIDIQKAENHYLQAAENGNILAQENIAALYMKNNKKLENTGKAIIWFLKAAESNSFMAQKSLAYIYHAGIGVPQNLDKAASWYEKAAAQGDDLLIDNGLCFIYYSREEYSRALNWCERAAERKTPEAAGILGFFYATGTGVERDFMKAGSYFKIGMDGGNKFSARHLLPRTANCIMTKADETGRFPDDIAEQCLVAAGADSPHGLYKAGMIHETGQPGLNIAPDMAKADDLRQKALALGYRSGVRN